MEKIARKLTDLVGNTPLLELSNYNKSNGLKARLIVKIESFNPAGSVKDRVALAMIEDAEVKGVLTPGATIIEPTSGNTGVGLAFVPPDRAQTQPGFRGQTWKSSRGQDLYPDQSPRRRRRNPRMGRQ